MRGVVQLVTVTRAVGWAMDSAVAGHAVEIRVSLHGREVMRVRADEFRDDLLRRGFGDGRHGFVAVFAERVPDELRSALEFRAIDSTGQETLLAVRSQFQPLRFDKPQDPYARPVFILGSPRSGTSAITAALLNTTHYQGHSEGHVLPLLPILQAELGKYYDMLSGALEGETTLATIPQGYFQAKMGEMFIDVMRARFNTRYWAVKTPSNYMIVAAPRFAELWPNARFIFMKRRGIENLVSRLQKFPNDPFERQCRDWTDAMFFWSKTRDQIGSKALEIDQIDLVRNSADVAVKLGRLLDLSQQDQEAFRIAIAEVRPEQTSAEIGRVTSMEAVDWTPEQKTRFREICGPMMAAYGYSEGPEYFARPAATSGPADVAA